MTDANLRTCPYGTYSIPPVPAPVQTVQMEKQHATWVVGISVPAQPVGRVSIRKMSMDIESTITAR